ncbi:MAG: hypothetical protein IPK16_13225 [Anaerolineales bacterium]|nr:hypothetical protein [Anaerolineales bacterium]
MDEVVEQPVAETAIVADGVLAPEASCVERTKDIGADKLTYVDSRNGVVGGMLKIGSVEYAPTQWRQAWTLVHFNPAGSIPSNSQLIDAKIKLSQTGVEAGSGNIYIYGYRANSSWNPGLSFSQAQTIRGSQFTQTGAVGTSPGTVSISAKAPAAEWLTQGSGNTGAILTPSQGGMHNFSFGATLSMKYRCDFTAPGSQMDSFNRQYHNAYFDVRWRGADPNSSNCGASGLSTFTVQYSLDNSNWRAYATSNGATCTSNLQYGGMPFDNSVWKFAEGTKVYFRVTSKDYAGNKQSGYINNINTILDFTPPVVTFTPLPAYTFGTTFNVNWTAIDNLSGVEGCKLYQQINGGAWTQAPGNITRNGNQFTYTVTGAANLQKWGFKATCTDNATNVSPDPGTAQATTTVSLYPQTAMSNITPNLVQSNAADTKNLSLRWTALASPWPVTSFRVYYRHTVGTQVGAWTAWKNFNEDVFTAKFPFTTVDPAKPNGLWDFQVIALSAQGTPPFQTTRVQASAVTDLNDKGEPSYMPSAAKR